jgi:hypothetical protein
MSAQNTRSEKTKAALKLLQNPYASLSLEDETADDASSDATMEQKHAYYRKLENPCAFDAVFGEPTEPAQQVVLKTSSIGLSRPQSRGISKKDFEEGCRRILRQYVPPSEGQTLRPHYRDFIARNARRSPEQRSRILDGLSKYDLATSGNFSPQFNREQELLTVKKLQQIENTALAVKSSA